MHRFECILEVFPLKTQSTVSRCKATQRKEWDFYFTFLYSKMLTLIVFRLHDDHCHFTYVLWAQGIMTQSGEIIKENCVGMQHRKVPVLAPNSCTCHRQKIPTCIPMCIIKLPWARRRTLQRTLITSLHDHVLWSIQSYPPLEE